MFNNNVKIDKSRGIENNVSGIHCRNPQTIEFATLADANRVRWEFSDCVISQDDARKKTISYCGDAPVRVREAIERIAYHSFENNDGFGQTPLTAFERHKIDFSRTNVFHARSCKAISVEFCVDDWLARYDWTLNVSEHVEIYRRSGQPTATTSGPTMRDLAGVGWS